MSLRIHNSIRFVTHLLFSLAVSGFLLSGCVAQDAAQDAVQDADPGLSVKEAASTITDGVVLDPSIGRDAWRVNDYHKAVEFYMSLDLLDQPDLLFERGRLLLEVAEYYSALNDFAVPVKTHLLSVWQAQHDSHLMDSPSLNCQLAIDAYTIGDYSLAASYRNALGEGVDPDIMHFAQAAVALGMLKSGQGDAAKILIDSLVRVAEDAPALALRLQRYLGENGEIELAKKINISSSADQIAATGISNAVIVDQAWKVLQLGDVRSVLRELESYRPEVPIWQEDIGVKGDTTDRTRKIFSLDFIPLFSRIYFKLAREDMVRVTSEEGTMGLQALYYAGIADYRAGDIEQGIEELRKFADKTSKIDDPYLEYFAAQSRILTAIELRRRGKETQADEMRDLFPAGDSYRHWAIEALDLYENFHQANAVVDSSSLSALAGRLSSVNYNKLRGTDRYYFYEAALKTSLVLIRGNNDQVELSRRLLENIYDKTSSYKVGLEKPALLLSLAQVYYKSTKVSWGLSKNIVELMGPTFPECVPVAYIFAYLQTAANIGAGRVTPGS
jgi:hypothetical protein